MKIKVTHIAHHRNGCGGEGFHVVLFRWDKRRMVATLYESKGQCSVLDIGLLVAGDIVAFGKNSWRGDDFEPYLRKAIDAWEEARENRTAIPVA